MALVTAATAAMRRAAKRLGLGAELRRLRRAGLGALGGGLAHQPPDALQEAMRALDAAAVHSMSRSGGVSDSMNQRAVSAP